MTEPVESSRTPHPVLDPIRANLRAELLVDVLIMEKEGVIQVQYGGGGDSGDIDATGNTPLDEFFAEVVDHYCQFDWWNNEGGGGDITWNLVTDTLTLNGYYHTTSTEHVLLDEVV